MNNAPVRNRIIIGAALACALIVAAIPAGVGQLLRHWGPDLLAEWSPDAELELETGWLRSAARINLPDGQRMDLVIGHLPLLPPALLSAEGWLETADTSEPVAVTGRLGLLGRSRIQARHPEMVIRERGSLELDGFQMEMDLRIRGSQVAVTADRLAASDPEGNRLDLEQWQMQAHWNQDEQGLHFELEASGQRPGSRPSRMAAEGRNIAQEPAARMIEFWGQTTAAEAGSTQETLARIGLLEAFQELQDKGLEIHLHELVLDGAFLLAGQWKTTDRRFGAQLEGRGTRQALEDWMNPIIGISMQLDPEQGPAMTREVLQALAGQGWLSTRNGDLEFQYPADPDVEPDRPPEWPEE